MDRPYDVAVIGAGPAGLALAGALCARGARVAVVDPAPDRPWHQTFCAFADELPDAPAEVTWSRVAIELPGRRVVRDRPYVQVDTAALQGRLRRESAGASRVVGAVIGHGPGEVRTDAGTIQARHTVDCTGARQILGTNGPSATAFQTAWGVEIETHGHPWSPDEAVWMDLRDLAPVPSFLYVLPRSTTRVFVEETVLAARPAVPIPPLRHRLEARLDALGVRVARTIREESVRIPLDLPDPSGLAFGAAAGMIHPATGYSLARSLALAGPFADALLRDHPEEAMATLRSATRGLHRLGLDVLTRCDGDELTAFFAAFFDQPAWATDAFLSSRPALWSTVAAMSRLFATSRVRHLLLRPVLRPAPVESACPPL